MKSEREILGFDLNLLITFLIVYQEQSVSRAAVRLHVTQPAVSNTLKKLRDIFDDELFLRQGKKLVATQRATEISEILKNVPCAIAQALDLVYRST
ncbi:LysR family transcriptional regulator [Pseudomonas sp. MHK4]|jgi:DNA-binding transcriptional LysR family regulator